MSRLLSFATGKTLIERLDVRATFWGRFRGLLFYRNTEEDSAVWLMGTGRIHTFGMLFPLDLYFFDPSLTLIGFRRGVRPWSLPLSPRGTKHILEVRHRADLEPLGISPGDKVSILWIVKS